MDASTRYSTALLVAVVYLLTAMACALASQYRAPGRLLSVEHGRPWRLVAIGLILIAVDALFDGDRALVAWLRGMARAEGWYAVRRMLQLAVLAILLPAALLFFAGIWRAAAATAPPLALRLTLVGVALILTVLCLRVVSYHHADTLMDQRVAAMSVARWLELAGLALVGLGAMHKLLFTYSMR